MFRVATRGRFMPADRSKSAKQGILRQHATLNSRPDAVALALFKASEFFDPHDLLQVKYEMLRLVNVDQRSISDAAKACGFSRPSFYQAQWAFEQGGLAGLIAHKPGPHGGHKLTSEVLQFVAEARAADPGVRAEQLAQRVGQRFGVQVHPRSIERQLRKKKPR
jgi:transposase